LEFDPNEPEIVDDFEENASTKKSDSEDEEDDFDDEEDE